MSQADDRQATGGVAAPGLPGGRFWRFELRRPDDTAGTEPRLNALRVAAKTRFYMDEWMDEADVERALTGCWRATPANRSPWAITPRWTGPNAVTCCGSSFRPSP